jgi:preprotein translocase SecF subunit
MMNILRYRWISLIVSATILLSAGLLSIYRISTRGHAFSYSVDFTGGTQVLFKFDKPISASEIHTSLSALWPSVTLRTFSPTEHLVRVKEFSHDAQGLAVAMKETIEKIYPENNITILENDAVGPGVGSALRYNLYKAILIALALMLVYIAVRFWSLGFAVGSVVALLHDALIMLAVFILLDKEISITVIGAILAVIGYSINDTIVIFSQIRENLNTLKRTSVYDIVNISLNQTMRRTLLTSFSTALTVISLLVLGGEALRDFALALLVGIIFGTYSSIYIASPIVMWFDRDKKAIS